MEPLNSATRMLSICLATRNRSKSLERLLSSILLLEQDGRPPFQIIIVDNGSTDDTLDMVRSFATRLPIQLLNEPRQGASYARNRAAKNAFGDYIIWTDDDTTVHPKWLASYAAAIDRFPDAAFFGGAVTPVLEPGGARWFVENREVFHLLTATRTANGNSRPGVEDKDDLPYGANWAIRTDLARKHPFDVELGPSGKRRRGGEESAVMHALLTEGHHGEWVPGAQVLHYIPAGRQTLGYVWRFYAGLGEMVAFLAARQGRRSRLLAALAYLAPTIRAFARLAFALCLRPSSIWTRRLKHAAYISSLMFYSARFTALA